LSHFRPKEVLHRAQQSEKEGQKKEAARDYALLSVYLRKKNKFSDAGKMISKAIALTPDSGRLYLEEAACLFGLKEESRAGDSLQKCIQLGLEKKQLQVYLDHLNKHMGNCAPLRRRFFELWLSIDRTTGIPFLGLGEELVQESNWGEAKQLFIKGLRVEPENKLLWDSLEAILQKQGNEIEQDYFKRFKEKSLSYEDFVMLIGKPPEKTGHGKAEIRSVEKSSELKELSELVTDLERELELDSDEDYENLEPVIQEFLRKSNQVIGSDLQARLDLAFAFFEMGRFREAKLELNYIEAEHLLFGQAQHLLGNILMKEGSEVAALGAFQSALRTALKGSSFWKETVYQLIKINIKLGDRNNAKKLLEQIEKVDPLYRDLKNLKQNLKQELK
jgi:tetratricopeptide (TPR) repeat protein